MTILAQACHPSIDRWRWLQTQTSSDNASGTSGGADTQSAEGSAATRLTRRVVEATIPTVRALETQAHSPLSTRPRLSPRSSPLPLPTRPSLGTAATKRVSTSRR